MSFYVNLNEICVIPKQDQQVTMVDGFCFAMNSVHFNLVICIQNFCMHHVRIQLFLQCVSNNLANALAKCLHSALNGHALQLGLLFVQKTCAKHEAIIVFFLSICSVTTLKH